MICDVVANLTQICSLAQGPGRAVQPPFGIDGNGDHVRRMVRDCADMTKSALVDGSRRLAQCKGPTEGSPVAEFDAQLPRLLTENMAGCIFFTVSNLLLEF